MSNTYYKHLRELGDWMEVQSTDTGRDRIINSFYKRYVDIYSKKHDNTRTNFDGKRQSFSPVSFDVYKSIYTYSKGKCSP